MNLVVYAVVAGVIGLSVASKSAIGEIIHWTVAGTFIGGGDMNGTFDYDSSAPSGQQLTNFDIRTTASSDLFPGNVYRDTQVGLGGFIQATGPTTLRLMPPLSSLSELFIGPLTEFNGSTYLDAPAQWWTRPGSYACVPCSETPTIYSRNSPQRPPVLRYIHPCGGSYLIGVSSAVPEPSRIAFFGLGIGLAACVLFRNRWFRCSPSFG